MSPMYYIPAQRLVVGTNDPTEIAYLVGTYMRHLPPSVEVGRYDGTIMHGAHVYTIVGCVGKGTGTFSQFAP